MSCASWCGVWFRLRGKGSCRGRLTVQKVRHLSLYLRFAHMLSCAILYLALGRFRFLLANEQKILSKLRGM